MVTKPNLIFYASVSKGTTVVAEFNSQDADLAALAGRCLEKTPQLHATFSHTIRKRTYTFLIDDVFVYFAIHDEDLENSESLAFLRSVKEAFEGTIGVGEKLSSHCFQGEFSPVLHRLLSPAETESLRSPPGGSSSTHSRNGSLDSPRGKRVGLIPLLKKKRRHTVERHVGSPEEKGNPVTRELPVSMQKENGGLLAGEVVNQRAAKKVWKKHVWVVLSVDLIVCCMLFGIWLWVCKGFKCIDE